MTWRKLELIVCSIFFFVVFAEFVPFALNLRLFGQNLLNARLWSYLSLIVILVPNPKILKSKSMLFWYLYLGIYLVLELFGHYDLMGIETGRTARYSWFYNQHFPLGTTLIISEHLLSPSRRDDLKVYIKVILSAIVITCFSSLYVITRFPGAVRGQGDKFYNSDYLFYRTMGLAGYSFFSMIPFLIPGLVLWLKNNIGGLISKRAVMPFFVIVLIFITSYRGVYVAPFLLSVFVFVISILGRKRVQGNIALTFVLLALVLLIPRFYLSEFLYATADLTPNKDLSTKINDIGLAVSTGLTLESSYSSTSVESRAERIPQNVRQFIENPLIGKGIQGNEHIFWLNLLAQFGLIGTIPLIIVLFHWFKKITAVVPQYSRFYAIISLLSFVLLGFMKVLAGYLMFLVPILLVPMMCVVLDMEGKLSASLK